MKSQFAFISLLIGICTFGAWMLAANRHEAMPQVHSAALSADVSRAAEDALNTGELAPLLRWVRRDEQPRICELFQRVQRLRQRDDTEIREFAEQTFLQSLSQVRAPRSTDDPSSSLAMQLSQ